MSKLLTLLSLLLALIGALSFLAPLHQPHAFRRRNKLWISNAEIIADLKRDKESLNKEKELIWQSLSKDKELLIKDKEDLKGELLKLTQAHLEEIAQYRAITEMRPVLELMVKNCYSSGRMPTHSEALGKIAREELLATSSSGKVLDLNQDAKAMLTLVEGNDHDSKSVAYELEKLYHEVSKEHHFLPPNEEKGFICGGKMPLRAAVFLMIATLQKKCEENQKLYVRYFGDNNVEKARVFGGNVVRVNEITI